MLSKWLIPGHPNKEQENAQNKCEKNANNVCKSLNEVW